MRTTISISDELLVAAKRRARDQGLTLGELVDSALQRELNQEDAPSQPPVVPVFTGGTGPRPGVNLRSNRAMAEMLDEGQPLDKLR